MTTLAASRATLGAVISLLRVTNLSKREREELISAIRTVAKAIGKKSEAILTDLRSLNAELARALPARAGISESRWRNAVSLLRKALRIAGRHIMPGRSCTPVAPAWLPLFDSLPTRSDRYSLSKPIRWLSVRDIGPSEVTPIHLDAYRRDVVENSLGIDAAQKWLTTRHAWNRSAERVLGWPQFKIPVESKAKDKIYSLPLSSFPDSLQQDISAWCKRASSVNLADDDAPAKPLAAATIKSRRHLFQSFASALVCSGVDPQSLTSLTACLTTENYERGLHFFLQRLGLTNTIFHKAFQLRSVARHWCEAAEPTLERMGKIVRKLDVGKPGLTEKNRRLLLQLKDEDTRQKLFTLSDLLHAEMVRGRIGAYRSVVQAQRMVAVEILLSAPMRIKNLVSLELDRHLQWSAEGVLRISIPAAEVKNDQPLHFEFRAERAALIRWHIDRLRRADPTCRWLFPGEDTKHKTEHTLAVQLQTELTKRIGVSMNVHLFRHFAAMVYLEKNPGDYETIRRLFGHKRLQTTINFYVDLETLAAARHFDDHIQKLQDDARRAIAP